MLINLSKTEASVYRAWINAAEWLDPKIFHEDGTKVQEARAFTYLGQRKERKGAQTEASVRIVDAHAAWQALKTKIFRTGAFLYSSESDYTRVWSRAGYLALRKLSQ